MRHLRPFAALLTVAAVTIACSGPPGSSSGGSSQGGEASQAGGASQPAASTGGGGGGGGGANGSITYDITGDYQASGELPFLPGGISMWIESAHGWVANFADPSGGGAVIVLNTQEGQSLSQGLTYGDGSITIVLASDLGNGMGCDFTLDKNDADGLKGHVDCSSALAVDGSGAQKHVQFSAEWDAHP